jgi:hypothetical protein
VAFAGLCVTGAQADTEPLAEDAVNALAVTSCQLDPLVPLSLEEMSPVVLAEVDVEVVPGEISVHLVRAEVLTSAGDVQQCTFGVLHRDAQLKQVQHVGTASLALVDTLSGTSYGVDTEIELGNMGKGSAIDPTAEVSLGGFLTPLENAVEDPTYAISLDRKSIEVVQIASNRAVKDRAGKLLKVQLKAAAKLEKKQLKAAKSKGSAKKVAAAERAYAKRVAAAQAAYDRAIGPKTVSRPVAVNHMVTGTVSVNPAG